MKGIIDEWGKEHRIETCGGIDSGGTVFYKDLIKLKQRISKAIDEILDIYDDVGKGCNKEDEVMFRSGYKNGRGVFKSELKQTLLTGGKDGKN